MNNIHGIIESIYHKCSVNTDKLIAKVAFYHAFDRTTCST